MQLFYPYVFGGGEYIFFLITRELVKRGHNVHVITQLLHGTQPMEVFEGIQIHRVGSQFVSSDTLPPTIKYHLQYLIHASKKGREIIIENRRRGENIEVIHSNTYAPALCGHLCSRFYGIPHIVTFHDIYQASSNKFWKDWMSKQKGNTPFYASTVAKFIEKLVLRLDVSAFHTVSEMSKQDLMSFGISNDKIAVIPNGIDRYQYQEYGTKNSNYTLREPIAVFVGRLIFYKNIETVIKAFKNVVKVIPNAQLIIIGEGPHKKNLVEEAESLQSNILFTGRIPHTEKIKIIKKSSFMVFPSLIEGFGIAIIEGFACNKPVLVSDIRPLSDIVKDGYTGFVIPPFDIYAWEEKMIQLFNNRTKQEEMGKNAYQEFLSNYEIEKIASRIEQLYETVINR
jgi:glycosyltransferase involved in cell wall biosynthesis